MDIVIYTIQTADVKDIAGHLQLCNDNFVFRLDSRVNLNDYSQKLHSQAVTFEAWVGDKLIGLVAGYFNDAALECGFISNVSVLTSYAGKGIASELMRTCIQFGKSKGYRKILLEVDERASAAIRLYKKFGFTEIAVNESSIRMKLILNNKQL